MLIERKLPISEFGELNLSSKYKIIYLEGSPEERRSQISCLEDSLFLKDLDVQNPKNNSLLLKLSFDGLINPGLFKGLNYVSIQPTICQFIPSDAHNVPVSYFSLIKLSSWINIKKTKKGNCGKCSIARNVGSKSYCPIIDTDDDSGITFGIYFTLTEKEIREYKQLRESNNIFLPVVGMSLISNVS